MRTSALAFFFCANLDLPVEDNPMSWEEPGLGTGRLEGLFQSCWALSELSLHTCPHQLDSLLSQLLAQLCQVFFLFSCYILSFNVIFHSRKGFCCPQHHFENQWMGSSLNFLPERTINDFNNAVLCVVLYSIFHILKCIISFKPKFLKGVQGPPPQFDSWRAGKAGV